MLLKGRGIVIVLIVLMSITLAFAGSGFFLLQKEKLRTMELEESLKDLNKKQTFTEEELMKSKKQITALQTRLDESRNEIKALTADLELQKKDTLASQVKMEQLNIDLAQQQQFRQDLESKFNLAQEDLRKAMVKIKEMDSERGVLETKVKELESKTQEVELGKIVVSPDADATGTKHYEIPEVSVIPSRGAQASGVQGKVLVVNKEYNFVVINLGAKDGVDVGDEFSVFDNENPIGDIKIEKVHDSMAAAGFLTADMKNKVSEGQKIVQKVR